MNRVMGEKVLCLRSAARIESLEDGARPPLLRTVDAGWSHGSWTFGPRIFRLERNNEEGEEHEAEEGEEEEAEEETQEEEKEDGDGA